MKTIKAVLIALVVAVGSLSMAKAQTRFHVSVNTPGVHVSAGNYHRGYYRPGYYGPAYYRPAYAPAYRVYDRPVYYRHYYRPVVYRSYYRHTYYRPAYRHVYRRW